MWQWGVWDKAGGGEVSTWLPTMQVVLEEADVPGQGHFVAYADGRLRAMFDDRTILHLNAARSYCKVRGGPVGRERGLMARHLMGQWAGSVASSAAPHGACMHFPL